MCAMRTAYDDVSEIVKYARDRAAIYNSRVHVKVCDCVLAAREPHLITERGSSNAYIAWQQRVAFRENYEDFDL
jgi:hypothetical protein